MKINYLFFLFLGLFITSSCCNSSSNYPEQVNYLKKHAVSPQDYLVEKFKTSDIILLGEDHAIKNNVEMVGDLIPVLYKAGVYNLTVEFGAFEKQKAIDSLLSAPSYDENLVRRIMYFYNVGWAYKEYMDLYRKAWSFNQTLKEGEKPFRVVNMSYHYNWIGFDPDKDNNPNDKVFYLGPCDDFRAALIEREIIEKGEKTLVLTGSIHAYTSYVLSTGYKTLGSILYAKYPEKVFNVYLNYPVIDKTYTHMQLIANGALDEIMKDCHLSKAGFDFKGTPMGDLTDSSALAIGHDNFTLKDYFDGCIYLGPASQMEGCTFDSLFFQEHTWKEIYSEVPDKNWNNPKDSISYMNKIKSYVVISDRYKIE